LVVVLFDKIDAILQTLKIELSRKYCLILTDDEAKLYDNPKPFGDDIFNNFPDHQDDIVNAHQCLALGQDNAAVHLVIGVIEKEVRLLKTQFSVWTINPDEWGGIVDEMSKKMPKWLVPKGSAEEKQKDEVDRMLGNLRHVNRGYRIYSAHRKQDFRKHQAMAIFSLSKSSLEEIWEVKSMTLKLPVL